MFTHCKSCGRRRLLGKGWINQFGRYWYCPDCWDEILLKRQDKEHKKSEESSSSSKKKKRSSRAKLSVFDSYGKPISSEQMHPITVADLKKVRKIKSKDDVPLGHYGTGIAAKLCGILARSSYAGEDRGLFKRLPRQSPFLEIIAVEKKENFVPKVFLFVYLHGIKPQLGQCVPDFHCVFEV